MSDCDDCRVGELSADRLLDEVVCLEVNGGRRFVQHEDLRLTKQRPSQTYQLTLTDAARTSEQMVETRLTSDKQSARLTYGRDVTH